MPTQANSFFDEDPDVIFRECRLEKQVSRNMKDIKEIKRHLAIFLVSIGLDVTD
jgi:hypothetical protein